MNAHTPKETLNVIVGAELTFDELSVYHHEVLLWDDSPFRENLLSAISECYAGVLRACYWKSGEVVFKANTEAP